MIALVVVSFISVVSPLLAGLASYLLYDGLKLIRKKQLEFPKHEEADLSKKTKSVADEQLKKLRKELELREEVLKGREVELETKEEKIGCREQVLTDRENSIHELETTVKQREVALCEKEKLVQDIEYTSDDKKENGACEPEIDNEKGQKSSAKEKRKQLIKEELNGIIREVEEDELEEEMEIEAKEALHTAALKVAYLKKFYDVFKDEFILFPSVTKCVVSYVLMEEAEKYYFDEEDEFPLEYSAGLRTIATTNMGDDDEDEEYMEKLAMDVEV